MSMLSDLALKMSALAVLAIALTVLMRKASASARHLVLIGACAGSLTMAAAKVALPTIPLFVLPAMEPVTPGASPVNAPPELEIPPIPRIPKIQKVAPLPKVAIDQVSQGT